MLILKALSSGPKHGYGAMRWIEEATGSRLQVEEGTLYPALHRLERRKLVSSTWGRSENNRQAKYYLLTVAGRKALTAETAGWFDFAAAMTAALRPAPTSKSR
jgi:PadR family transcriptional regulator PadR